MIEAVKHIIITYNSGLVTRPGNINGSLLKIKIVNKQIWVF